MTSLVTTTDVERSDGEDINLVTPTRPQPNPHSSTEQQQRWTAHTYRIESSADCMECSQMPSHPFQSPFYWLSSLTSWWIDARHLDWLHMEKCDLLRKTVWRSGFLRSWTQLFLQLVPWRNLGCFITVEYKVVLCFRVFYCLCHSESTIYGINLQTISQINCFNFYI